MSVWIGTSGWSYKHWEGGVFYPPHLPAADHLRFYTEHFPTVELNASFYNLPKPATAEHWRENTPDDFLFAVKLSRFITHRKRLHECHEPLERFFGVMNRLGSKRGPLLIQLSPATKRNDDLLRAFLDDLIDTAKGEWRVAFEFRHKSWLDDEVFKMLERRDMAVVVHDMPYSVNERTNGADFVYVRRHGGKGRYAGKYTEAQLRRDEERIRDWNRQGRDVFVYFNNDVQGFAVENAKTLTSMVHRLDVPDRAVVHTH